MKNNCRRILPIRDEVGIELGMRYTPVDAAGLYVPGGKAAYPSSVLMNAIPALVAGVDRRVMVVPARDGEVNPLVLAAAALAGVSEVWRIGGAQAVAALAYGTETISMLTRLLGREMHLLLQQNVRFLVKLALIALLAHQKFWW